jgi:hypothetical protein
MKVAAFPASLSQPHSDSEISKDVSCCNWPLQEQREETKANHQGTKDTKDTKDTKRKMKS